MGRKPAHTGLKILATLELAPSVRMAARYLGMSRPALKVRCRRDGSLMAAYEACRARGEPRRGSPLKLRAELARAEAS